MTDIEKKKLDKIHKARDKLKNDIYNLSSLGTPTHIFLSFGRKTEDGYDNKQVMIDESELVNLFVEFASAVAENKKELLQEVIEKTSENTFFRNQKHQNSCSRLRKSGIVSKMLLELQIEYFVG